MQLISKRGVRSRSKKMSLNNCYVLLITVSSPDEIPKRKRLLIYPSLHVHGDHSAKFAKFQGSFQECQEYVNAHSF
ncbi:hypothetical protein [Anabaena azotica]|uniref:Uncharacterized protein n=1 Tax=Anabaena azotica FACHB-119 TaxID=947527 RepID=A0ABR8D919_9NOST|nr:hypothetical protein [Anabaena azotica]MBD2503431.1 hypothetical protein [Anabaena azotica FACHB-119]